VDDNPETRIIDHKEVYRGKIVRLQVDTVRLDTGRDFIREVVKHPGGVVAVPIMADGRLLLLRQFRYPLQKYIFEFPAGKLDSNQPPLETIAREIEEESGHRAGEIIYQFSFCTSPGISDEIIHLYLARDLSPVVQKLEEGEHITIEAYSLAQCLEMIRKGEIIDGKTIIGILWLHTKNDVK
jgi:ADP-ribose pyrophosphatase